jgi:uncharacterized protein (DUF1499 family)
MTTAPRSPLGRVSTWLGRLSVLFVLSGPLLAYLELVRPLVGFAVFGFGLLCAVLSLALGVLALLVGPSGTRGTTGGGMLPAIVVILLVLAASGARTGVPRINDITTDTANPPAFVHAPTLPENVGRDMTYPGESFAQQQREGYGEIEAVQVALPADETFRRVAAAARSMDGWVITREDPTSRALEGYETSGLFRFKDDFVIVVREQNGQSVVHMRSKSRDGQGDLGVNAQRIRTFLARVKE